LITVLQSKSIRIVSLLGALLFFSCKSAPAPVPAPESAPVAASLPPEQEVAIATAPEEAVAEEIVIEPAEEEIDLAALEARKKLFDDLGEVLAEARAKREEIITNEYNNWYPERFEGADGLLQQAAGVWDAGFEAFDGAAPAAGQAALLDFKAIIEAVWIDKADTARNIAANAQQDALKLKADVAVKSEYNRAAELFNKGNAALRDREYETAVQFYEESEPVFTDAIKLAAEKKAKAEVALKNAETKIAESEKIVGDAAALLEEASTDTGELL